MAAVTAGVPRLTGRAALDRRLTPLVLASASPRRIALLAAAGLPFQRAVAAVDESLLPGESAEAACRRLAEAKALAAGDGQRVGCVLAGDTLVSLDGRPLGKPADVDEARAVLTLLSGRTHDVFSAAAALRARDRKLLSGVAHARVACAPLDDALLDAYLATGEWEGKAGAYAIQGQAGRFARLVEGDLDTVIGLNLTLVAGLLGELAVEAR